MPALNDWLLAHCCLIEIDPENDIYAVRRLDKTTGRQYWVVEQMQLGAVWLGTGRARRFESLDVLRQEVEKSQIEKSRSNDGRERDGREPKQQGH
jgi:hypothetical protein